METQPVVVNLSFMLHLTPRILKECLTLKHRIVESPIGKLFLLIFIFSVWYHFYVQGLQPGETAEFVLKNLSVQQKLYQFGQRPHYKEVYEDLKTNYSTSWGPVPGEVSYSKT